MNSKTRKVGAVLALLSLANYATGSKEAMESIVAETEQFRDIPDILEEMNVGQGVSRRMRRRSLRRLRRKSLRDQPETVIDGQADTVEGQPDEVISMV